MEVAFGKLIVDVVKFITSVDRVIPRFSTAICVVAVVAAGNGFPVRP